MPMEKSLLTGSTALLVLKLLEDGDKYGYQMVEELRRRSDKTFELKSGTLYPLLHTLEQKGSIQSWEEATAAAAPAVLPPDRAGPPPAGGERGGMADLCPGHAPSAGRRGEPCLTPWNAT